MSTGRPSWADDQSDEEGDHEEEDPSHDEESPEIEKGSTEEKIAVKQTKSDSDTGGGYENRARAPVVPSAAPFIAYVGGIHFHVVENELAAVFKRAGCTIQNIVIHYEYDGKSKGFSHVEFSDMQSLNIALKLNGTEIRGRNIKVDVSEGRSTNRDRRSNRDYSGRDHRGGGRDSPRGDSYNNRGGIGSFIDRGNRNQYSRINGESGGHRQQQMPLPRRPVSDIPSPTVNTSENGDPGLVNNDLPVPPAPLSAGRPKLDLKPRTLPVTEIGKPVVVDPAIFGEGKPRNELVLVADENKSKDTEAPTSQVTTVAYSDKLEDTQAITQPVEVKANPDLLTISQPNSTAAPTAAAIVKSTTSASVTSTKSATPIAVPSAPPSASVLQKPKTWSSRNDTILSIAGGGAVVDTSSSVSVERPDSGAGLPSRIEKVVKEESGKTALTAAGPSRTVTLVNNNNSGVHGQQRDLGDGRGRGSGRRGADSGEGRGSGRGGLNREGRGEGRTSVSRNGGRGALGTDKKNDASEATVTKQDIVSETVLGDRQPQGDDASGGERTTGLSSVSAGSEATKQVVEVHTHVPSPPETVVVESSSSLPPSQHPPTTEREVTHESGVASQTAESARSSNDSQELSKGKTTVQKNVKHGKAAPGLPVEETQLAKETKPPKAELTDEERFLAAQQRLKGDSRNAQDNPKTAKSHSMFAALGDSDDEDA